MISPEKKAWIGMRQRCYNPRCPGYKWYGARGITVCKRWRGSHTFTVFLADMGLKPSPKHSLDRIDNDGPYDPKNCRWATWHEQHLNKRPSNKRMDLKGVRFGRLIAVEALPKVPKRCTKWLCRCDCGGITVTDIGKLRTGHTQSCGCYHREQTSKANHLRASTRPSRR